MTAGWTDPGWLAGARAWIEEQAGRLGIAVAGPPEQFHARPWATVLRVPTGAGDLYFKANAPQLRHEAALVAFLASRRPDVVPLPLAIDVERGWLLLADAGARLRELTRVPADLDRWAEILPLYAGLQIELAGDAGRLLELGVPDLRLDRLPSAYAQLLEGLPPSFGAAPVDVAWVQEHCDRLAAYGIPATIQHDDLDDAQVFEGGDGYRILDWADACMSHPFFTLSVTLEGFVQWGLDDVRGSVDTAPYLAAYLAPFEQLRSRPELEEAAAIALRLGWVCRAVNGWLGGSDAAQTRLRLDMVLGASG